jgi:hypothetical protein
MMATAMLPMPVAAAAPARDARFDGFFATFRTAVLAGDRRAVARMTRFPFVDYRVGRYCEPGDTACTIAADGLTCADETTFLRKYDRLFPRGVVAAIRARRVRGVVAGVDDGDVPGPIDAGEYLLDAPDADLRARWRNVEAGADSVSILMTRNRSGSSRAGNGQAIPIPFMENRTMRTPIQVALMLMALAAPAHGGEPARSKKMNLSAYVGKYPYDVVGGYRFFDHPVVRAAVARTVRDPRKRAGIRVDPGAVNVPIVRVAGGRILAWGGAKRAEDAENWAVVIAPDGSKPEVCIYDGLGNDDELQSSQWFEPGQPGIFKVGRCPSSAEEYPPRPIAAG